MDAQNTPEAAGWTEVLREKALWLLLPVVLVLFWRALLAGETFYFRDLHSHFYPERLLVARTLRAGQLPLWDPYPNGGRPLLANPNDVGLYPSILLYLALQPVVAFNLDIVLHFLLTAIAGYLLARSLGVSSAGAFAAGCVMAFAGYTLSLGNMLNRLYAMPWMPLALLFWHTWLKRRRSEWLVAAAMAMAVQILAGAPETSLLTLVLLLAWGLVAERDGPAAPGRQWMRIAGGWALAAILAGGLAAIQIVPAIDLVRQSTRAGGMTFDDFSFWSLNPRRLPELIAPSLLGDPSLVQEEQYRGAMIEDKKSAMIISIYFGIPALLAAWAGLAGGSSARRLRWLLAIATVMGIVLALGRYTPLLELLYRFAPPIRSLRFPVKFLNIAPLTVGLLAGFGIDQLWRAGRVRAMAAAAAALAIIAAGLYAALPRWASAFDSLVFMMRLTPHQQHEVVLSLAQTAVVASVALLLVGTPLRSWSAPMFAALICVDLVAAGMWVNPTAPSSLFTVEPHLAAMVRSELSGGRFYRQPDSSSLRVSLPSAERYWQYRWGMETLSTSTPSIYGIPILFHDDLDGLAFRDISRLGVLLERTPDWRVKRTILTASGVTLLLTPMRLVMQGIRPVGDFNDGRHRLVLYRNELVPSRPQIFFRAERALSLDALAARLVARDFEARSTILLGGPAARELEGSGSATVRTLSRRNHSAAYAVTLSAMGYLLCDIPAYRGWVASVDGRRAEVVPANGSASAVLLEAGTHRVEVSFEPLSWRIGAAITMMFAVVAALAVGLERLRSRHGEVRT